MDSSEDGAEGECCHSRTHAIAPGHECASSRGSHEGRGNDKRLGAKPAPLQTDGLVGDETEYQAWHTKLTEDRWKSLLQRAGEPDAGVILEARLVTESPLPGEDINLIFSLRNMSDRPFQPGWASLRPFESVVEPKLLIRNSKGEPVELTRKGMRRSTKPFSAAVVDSSSDLHRDVRGEIA